MTERVIDISQTGACLRVRHRQLVITLGDGPTESMPMDDIGVVVSSHPRTTFSQAVLSELIRQGGSFVVCDEKCLPVGMLLPLASNYIQVERMAAQANAKLPLKKRLWQQVVVAKVKAQSQLLQRLRGTDAGIGALAGRVRSGDPKNIEAQAARRYWGPLFNDPSFRRNHDADDQNRCLNYGYAVLRAIVARGVCAAGLHPSLGIQHHNRYSQFCLADDLMEPMRPIVDEAVVKLVDAKGAQAPLDKESKAELIGALQKRYECNGEKRTLFDISNRLGESLVSAFAGQKVTLSFPGA